MMAEVCDDAAYSKHKIGTNDFRLSRANLHKTESFKPLTKFCLESFENTMYDLGFAKKCCINSMWASEQQKGARHRPHQHFNCFLIGVYYLHGDGGNTPGTSFFNPNLGNIMPARNYFKAPKLEYAHGTHFVEGTLCIFPAWMIHYTEQYNGEDKRYTIGVNSMPVGKVKDPPSDRYDYMDVSDSDLEMDERETMIYNNRKEIQRKLKGNV